MVLIFDRNHMNVVEVNDETTRGRAFHLVVLAKSQSKTDEGIGSGIKLFLKKDILELTSQHQNKR